MIADTIFSWVVVGMVDGLLLHVGWGVIFRMKPHQEAPPIWGPPVCVAAGAVVGLALGFIWRWTA